MLEQQQNTGPAHSRPTGSFGSAVGDRTSHIDIGSVILVASLALLARQ